MYGNCEICGKRYGTDGYEWYDPCEHMLNTLQKEVDAARGMVDTIVITSEEDRLKLLKYFGLAVRNK